MEGTRQLARLLAGYGLAVCIFDFIGGSECSRSGGDMTEMSVLTEAADLMAVLDAVAARPGIDRSRLLLMGESQGGFVATYTAMQRPEVCGLIALYPAYVLQEDARRRAAAPGYRPGAQQIMGHTVGACYDRDALSFDIYERMEDYRRPVLLLHGTADPIVPLSVSQRAAALLPEATLLTIPGAGHGFTPPEEVRAAALCADWIGQRIL